MPHSKNSDSNSPNRQIFMVDGMHCTSCAIAVEAALKKHPQIANASVNFAADIAVIDWQSEPADFLSVQSTVARLGYRLHQNTHNNQRQQQAEHIRKNLQLRLAIAAFFGMWSMMPALLIYLSYFAVVEQAALLPLAIASGLFAIPVIIYSGSHFYRVGWRTLIAGAPGLDSLISLAVFSAVVISGYNLWLKSPHVYFDTAVMLISFQLLARLLDTGVRRRATEVLHAFWQDFPQHITHINAQGDRHTCLLKDINKNQRILLGAGQTLALDASVSRGIGLADFAMLSGEHEPQTVTAGDTLYAGCKLLEGELELTVTQTLGQRRIDTLSRTISGLLSVKTALQQITDRLARVLLPTVIIAALCAVGVALLAGLNGPQAAARALAVLVVTCPCALSLAIPLVITMGHAQMIKKGIILREPNALEAAAEISAIVFDKTGTLSTHQPSVKAVLPHNHFTPQQVLQLALDTLATSPHPVAQGLIKATQTTHTAHTEGTRDSIIGQGTRWLHGGDTTLAGRADWLRQEGIKVPLSDDAGMNIHLANNGRYAGCIVFQETPQAEAKSVIKQLHQQGFALYMLSGDTEQACTDMAKRVGINPDNIAFNQSPEDKHGFITRLQKQAKVAFVGDGLNDGLALACATLGIAVGETNATTGSAGAIYLSGSIDKLALTLRTAKKARRLMRQNLTWAIGYNAIVIPAAVMGWIQPVIAAIAMSLSSLCVLFNSLRIRKNTHSSH